MEPEIYRRAREFRSQLLASEENARLAILEAYSWSSAAINQSIEQLISFLVQRGDPLTGAQLERLDRWQQLLTKIDQEAGRFGQAVAMHVSQAQRFQMPLARTQALELMRIARPFASAFTSLPTGAIEQLVGFLQDGSPIARAIEKTFPALTERVKRELIVGLAQGKNPKAIARKIAATMEPPAGKKGQGSGPLAAALRIARTEVLRAHREASRETYQQNADVVQGWIWLSSRGTHTCAACLAMDGTTHPLGSPMGSHPNCRCVCLPWIIGDHAPTDTGQAWLERQSEKVQAEVLGRSTPDRDAAKAFRAGKVRLADFVDERQSDVWGTTRTARSLDQALASKVPPFYASAPGWQPSMPDPRGMPSDQRVIEDTRKIVDFVSSETGLPSRWSGKVLFSSDPDAEFLGQKLPECPIEYNRLVLGDAEFYLTALEESLHSVSVVSPSPVTNLHPFRGVEEAVVGACVQILKSSIRTLFGDDIAPNGFKTPISQDYLPNIKALGKLRLMTGIEVRPFYFGLLRTPLASREEALVKWIANSQNRSISEVSTDPRVLDFLFLVRLNQ